MDDLVRWLGEQFDEDERIADAARGQGDGRWHHDSSYPNGYVYDEHNQPVVYDESTPSPEEAEHIAAHDPARVLREIEAKRKLLDDHPIVPRDVEPTVINGEEIGGPYYPFGCATCHTEPDSPEVNGFGYCLTWKVLASVFADRSGYRAEWAPES